MEHNMQEVQGGYPQAPGFHQQQQQMFWAYQRQEMEQVTDFKNHNLPLARIKKIMKADEDVRMISAEAPILFAKACELFILELTLRSWIHAEENKRRTLQKNDIAAAITRTDIFDFLADIVPREENKEVGIVAPPHAAAAADAGGGAAPGVPYYYPPMGAGLYVRPPPAMHWWGEDGSAAAVYGGGEQGMGSGQGFVDAGHHTPTPPPPPGS